MNQAADQLFELSIHPRSLEEAQVIHQKLKLYDGLSIVEGVVDDVFESEFAVDQTLDASAILVYGSESVLARVRQDLLECLGSSGQLNPEKLCIKHVDSAVWMQAWSQECNDGGGFSCGDFVIVRADERGVASQRRIVLRNSDDAFGDGRHSTTRAVLKLLSRQSELVSKSVVLDLGTGNGVLAIALGMLGAEKVVATDLDEAIISEAGVNLMNNGWQLHSNTTQGLAYQRNQQNIDLLVADHIPDATVFDGICSNILLPELLRLMPSCVSQLKDDGWLILSGFHLEGKIKLDTELARYGLIPIDLEKENGWLAVLYRTRKYLL